MIGTVYCGDRGGHRGHRGRHGGGASALAWAAVSLLRTARQLRALAEELADHTSVVLGGVEVAMARAQGELDRVDDLVGSAEAINATVGVGVPAGPGGVLRSR